MDEIRSSSAIYVESLGDEVSAVLSGFTDCALEDYFLVNQAGISPVDHAGMSHREWLKEVRHLIAEELSRRRI